MEELITRMKGVSYYTNKLTEEMNTYLKYPNNYLETYIYSKKFNDNTWVIRYPGASRGYIKVDSDNIITDIILYDDIHNIYKDNVRECFNKYIGMKLIILPNTSINHKISLRSNYISDIEIV